MTASASTWIGWLVTYAIHSTLLLALASLVTRLPATSHGAARVVIWRAALFGALLTASVQMLSPLGPVRLAWPGNTGPAEAAVTIDEAVVERYLIPLNGGAGLAVLEPALPMRPSEMVGPAQAPGPPAAVWALVAYLVIALGIGGGHAWRRRRFARGLGRRERVESGLAEQVLSRLLASAGVRRSVRLTVSRRLASPIALGRGEICVPPRALSLGETELRALLAHELAHVVRRDPVWLTMVGVLESVFFFQVLNRYGRREMVAAAEETCDAWAVRTTGESRALARCLVEVASWSRRAHPVPVVGMAESGPGLERRVVRLVAGEDAMVAERGRTAGITAALLLVGLVACGAPGVKSDRARAVDPVSEEIALEEAEEQTAFGDGSEFVVEEEIIEPSPAPRDTIRAEKRGRHGVREYVWIDPQRMMRDLQADLPELRMEALDRLHESFDLEGLDERVREHVEGLDERVRKHLEGLESLDMHAFGPGEFDFSLDFGGMDSHLGLLTDGFGDGRLRVRVEGNVEIEDGEILSIGEDGRLEVVDNRDDSEKSVTVTPSADDGLEYVYRVDGAEQPFDDEARDWLKQIVSRIDSGHGLGRSAFAFRGPGHPDRPGRHRPEVRIRRWDRTEPGDIGDHRSAADRLRRRLERLEEEAEHLRERLESLEREDGE